MVIIKYKKLIQNNSVIFQNLTYITLLELFVTVSPLITYPYLIKTLGYELYGLVITAQVIASYAVILVDFGFRSISAKDISIHRNDKNKLSEIISSIFIIRSILWIGSFIVYYFVISIIPIYNKHLVLFLFAFGATFNDLLFPQFYFQGIEKMKFITFINIGINSIFILLIFLFIKNKTDYYLVPLFKSIGFFIGGLISMFIIFFIHKIKFTVPKFCVLKAYIKEALPIFSTKIITSIKDKFSYILLGSLIGMDEVVIYDLGAKLTAILVKPATILSRVLLPKIAKEKNIKLFKKTLLGIAVIIVLIILIINLLLPFIVKFFLSDTIDLLPLRIFLLAPLFLSLSSFIASCNIIAFGYYRYILYSIIITTIVYLGSTGIFYILNGLNSILTFILITVTAYFAELIYRLYISQKIINKYGI